jgi:hypothetical protein
VLKVRQVLRVLVLRVLVLRVLAGLMVLWPAAAFGQDPHAGHHEAPAAAWTFMQDAVVFGMYNQQGSPRGERELKVPNWWMGMAQRSLARGTLTVNLMLSLDPLTVGKQGYSHIMQAGETYDGNALIDHQHPHDFLMQAAAVWRRPLANGVALTLAGAAVGEPALGPIAFMHRSSAFENPMSPLGHHTLDSTHIAMGVLTAGLDRGPFQIESSLFHGGEPDERRWDLMDPGALDSWSIRGWYRPGPAWTFQLSHGFLTRPEALEEGNVRRTTASGSWKAARGTGSTSLTAVWGRNQKLGGSYDAFLAELTRAYGTSGTIFWRIESTQVETDLLRTGVHTFQGGRKTAHVVEDGRRDFVGAFSIGGTKTLLRPRAWDVAAGGMLTGYAVPASLSPFYGQRPPVSFQIFLRVRPPARHRMTDMTMTRPHPAS